MTSDLHRDRGRREDRKNWEGVDGKGTSYCAMQSSAIKCNSEGWVKPRKAQLQYMVKLYIYIWVIKNTDILSVAKQL